MPAASRSRSTTAFATISSTLCRCSSGTRRPSPSMPAPASPTAPPSSGGSRWSASSRARTCCRCRARGRRRALSTKSVGEKRRAFRLWADWLTLEADEARQRRAIRALAEKYGLDLAALARELIMDWDETAHDRRRAARHDRRAYDDASGARAPARRRRRFARWRRAPTASRRRSARAPRPSPFPTATRRPPRSARRSLPEQAGFAASFTTRPGYVPVAGSRQGLPRVSLNGLYQDVRIFEVLLSPGLWQLRNRIRGTSLSRCPVGLLHPVDEGRGGDHPGEPGDDEKGELHPAGRAGQLGGGDRHRRQRVDRDEDAPARSCR